MRRDERWHRLYVRGGRPRPAAWVTLRVALVRGAIAAIGAAGLLWAANVLGRTIG